jgi:hypothetical protein
MAYCPSKWEQPPFIYCVESLALPYTTGTSYQLVHGNSLLQMAATSRICLRCSQPLRDAHAQKKKNRLHTNSPCLKHRHVTDAHGK